MLDIEAHVRVLLELELVLIDIVEFYLSPATNKQNTKDTKFQDLLDSDFAVTVSDIEILLIDSYDA